ncbi:MAG: hypothetical protein JWO59_429 [Chloroflexi bacterium]|nr:hypothetical protein [Chloroflexota bacterium]
MTAESVNAPSREAVLAMEASPDFARDTLVFAATMSGLYRSRDGSRTWERIETAWRDLPLFSVAVSPGFASDGLLFVGAVEGGLLRGVCGGASWSLADFGGERPHCATLALSPEFARDGMAFAGTMSNGVFHSRTRGETWEARNFGLLDLHVSALAISPCFGQDETLYAATPSGLFRSPNGARAWREVAAPSADALVQCLALAAPAVGPVTLFAGTDGAGVFRSDDRGGTWQRTGTALAEATINGLILSPYFARDHTVLALTDSELYLSRDAGMHWECRAWASGALCLAVAPTFPGGGPVLIGRTWQGVERSSDLVHWQTFPVVRASTGGYT